MKIGFFTDSYWPTRHGVQVSIDSFARALELKGHNVYIYAPYTPGHKDDRVEIFRFKSVKVIKKPELRLAFPIVEHGRLKEVIKTKLDIVHVHSPFSMGLLGKYISKNQNIPMVYTHHTAYPDYAQVYFKEKYIIPGMAKWISALFSNWSNGVIAPSVKIEHTLREYGVIKPIYVLPTGIDLDFFKKSPEKKVLAESLREDWGVKGNDKVLLSLCRIDKAKNLGFIAESFPHIVKKYPNTKLVFVGDGKYLKELKQLVKNLGVAQSVVFPGFIDEKDKPAYYQAADAFLFASYTDTQGIVILEAMASRLPIVALQDESFEGQVLDDVNGHLVPTPSSPEVFAKRIIDLLGDSRRMRKLGRVSADMAKEYSEKHQAEKLLAIYRELIETHKNK